MDLVTVIIPSYNCAKYITKAIDSVLSQTYSNIEIIVIDDGSTDNTQEVLKGYKDKIKIITQKNKGVSSARNSGIAIATGVYIAMLDADDSFIPMRISRAVELLEQTQNTHSVITNCYTIGVHKKTDVLFKREIPCILYFDLIFKNTLAISSIISKRVVLQEIGGYDETLKIGEDYDLLLRLSLKYGGIFYIKTPLLTILQRPGSLSRRYTPGYKNALYKIYKKLGFSWYKRMFYANLHFYKYLCYMIKQKLLGNLNNH